MLHLSRHPYIQYLHYLFTKMTPFVTLSTAMTLTCLFPHVTSTVIPSPPLPRLWHLPRSPQEAVWSSLCPLDGSWLLVVVGAGNTPPADTAWLQLWAHFLARWHMGGRPQPTCHGGVGLSTAWLAQTQTQSLLHKPPLLVEQIWNLPQPSDKPVSPPITAESQQSCLITAGSSPPRFLSQVVQDKMSQLVTCLQWIP